MPFIPSPKGNEFSGWLFIKNKKKRGQKYGNHM